MGRHKLPWEPHVCLAGPSKGCRTFQENSDPHGFAEEKKDAVSISFMQLIFIIYLTCVRQPS